MYDLGYRLKKTRELRGLSQRDLARRINKSTSAVSSYETNAQMPPLDVLISICSVLNVSLDYLAGLSANKTLPIAGLSDQQIDFLELLVKQFKYLPAPKQELSQDQMLLIQKLITLLYAMNA